METMKGKNLWASSTKQGINKTVQALMIDYSQPLENFEVEKVSMVIPLKTLWLGSKLLATSGQAQSNALRTKLPIFLWVLSFSTLKLQSP